MAHTRLGFWALSIEPLSPAHCFSPEPVLLSALHGLPLPLSSLKEYPCFPTQRPIRATRSQKHHWRSDLNPRDD